MADFNTKYKLYPYRYVYTAPSKPAFTLRDVYKATTPFVFKSASAANIRAHDCREPLMKDIQDNHQWDTYILAHGLRATCESVCNTHTKPVLKIEERRPEKLLFHIGNGLRKSGKAGGEFSWPRSLAVSGTGDIIIADTGNHRIQTLNQYGVVVQVFGKFGAGDGEFNTPVGVAASLNGEIFVADSKNKRIQIFTRQGEFKESVATNDEPCNVAVDIHYNMIVATSKRTIEIYRKDGRLINRFNTHIERESGESCQLYIGVNDMEYTIIACDPTDRLVKIFNYTGDMLQKFQPCGPEDGLACIPAGIHILLNGQICVCDALNHCVCVFSDKGVFIKQLIGATDGCGAVQQCAAGPEGHLITTEYSTNNIHCLKIFRYKDCECHRYRPGSSKRPETPNRYQVKRGADSNASQSSVF